MFWSIDIQVTKSESSLKQLKMFKFEYGKMNPVA